MRALVVVACMGSSLFIAGCGGNSSGRLPIAGTITLKGQPIAEGTISFASKASSPEIFSGALIKAGQFSIPASAGLMPGAYVVRISAPQPGAAVTEPFPGVPGPPAKDLVPPDYNAASKLEYRVQSDGKNQFDLDIP